VGQSARPPGGRPPDGVCCIRPAGGRELIARRALASRAVEDTRVIPRPGTDSAAAEEQAALRRVATLVASGAEAPAIFRSVAEEAGRLLGAPSSATIRDA